jgi:hypothetical protein
MRNLQSNISIVGIQNICQGIALIVRNEAARPLRAYLSTLRWYASRLVRDARWQGLADMAMFMAKQPALCFATAKQHERHARVTGHRSVA